MEGGCAERVPNHRPPSSRVPGRTRLGQPRPSWAISRTSRLRCRLPVPERVSRPSLLSQIRGRGVQSPGRLRANSALRPSVETGYRCGRRHPNRPVPEPVPGHAGVAAEWCRPAGARSYSPLSSFPTASAPTILAWESQRPQPRVTGVGTFEIGRGQIVERYDGFDDRFSPLEPVTANSLVGARLAKTRTSSHRRLPHPPHLDLAAETLNRRPRLAADAARVGSWAKCDVFQGLLV